MNLGWLNLPLQIALGLIIVDALKALFRMLGHG